MRLDKAIASQGRYSRRDVKNLIRKSLVSVNGEAVSDPGLDVSTETDSIAVCGEPLEYKEHVYIMLNKPKGVISATEDSSQTTVTDLVPDELRHTGIFPAGRLDSDTTGFVLITDDGKFAHNMLSPRHHVEKTYLVTLSDPLTDEMMERVREGIELKDGTKCLPADVKKLSDNVAELKITEGKYHQIKRMFSAAGNRVTELKRTAIGGLTLDETLSPGECRELTEDEKKLIFVRN